MNNEGEQSLHRSLALIDLNLLKVLYMLLEERSASRAAARLFITQSAVSKSLQRLRTLMDDPLFIRSSYGLLPTPKAEETAARLRLIFGQIECCLIPSSFDLASASDVVKIAAPEHFSVEVIPRLVKRIHGKAPRLGVRSLHLMDDYLNMLAAGTLDFAITLNQPYPDNFISHPLSSSPQRIWMRQKHPLATRKKIDLVNIFAYPLITLRTSNATAQEQRAMSQHLSDTGLNPKVLLDTSHVLIAINTLINTDALMFAPDYLSRLSIYNNEIVPRTIDHIPIFGKVRVNLLLLQHSRTITSQLHRWIIGEICDEFAQTSRLGPDE